MLVVCHISRSFLNDIVPTECQLLISGFLMAAIQS